jgi:histidinol-phosphate aminotransferase
VSCNYHLLPHPGIQSLQPYVPGKSIEELAREQGISNIIKMASNENPLGCSPKAQQALQHLSSAQISSYPSPINHPIRQALSEKLAVRESMITLGNGSDLLFSLFITTFALNTGKQILLHEHAFMSYEIQAQILGVPFQKIPLKPNWQVDIDEMIRASQSNTALIFLANPNNPTGVLISFETIQRLISHVPENTIIVLDEAYHEFVPAGNYGESLKLLNQFPNLIITRTFSKAYGLAGLRLGYAIASPELTELLLRVHPPFAVNQLALQAAHAALEDEDFLHETLQLTEKGMQQMREGLETMSIDCIPSWGNFITFDCKVDGWSIYQALLKKGIIVRPLNAYHLPNHLRVTIGKADQNKRFLTALAQCLSEI